MSIQVWEGDGVTPVTREKAIKARRASVAKHRKEIMEEIRHNLMWLASEKSSFTDKRYFTTLIHDFHKLSVTNAEKFHDRATEAIKNLKELPGWTSAFARDCLIDIANLCAKLALA